MTSDSGKMTGKTATSPEPKMKAAPDRDWKADFKKLEAFLVSIGHGHRAIKRILEGE